MRLPCYFCGKSVSTEVPAETVIRALLVCPECIEAGKIEIPKDPTRVGERAPGGAHDGSGVVG